MCETVRPTSLAISLKVGTGGNALRSFLTAGARLAGATAGTGTVLGPWACTARLKVRKQIRRAGNFAGYPDMESMILTNIPPAALPAGCLHYRLDQAPRR